MRLCLLLRWASPAVEHGEEEGGVQLGVRLLEVVVDNESEHRRSYRRAPLLTGLEGQVTSEEK
jgi:hypothetical protein